MDAILQLDYSLFHWINSAWSNDFLDAIMPWWRSKYTWIPFYIILALFLIWRYKIKGLYLIMGVLITVGIADFSSSKVVKPTIKRLRPCKQAEIKDASRLLIKCGSGYSFTSSHATNHFAIATLLILTLGKRFRYIKLPLFFWALTIALGQVYVGVHFPLDILAGALLGSLIAWGMSRVYYRLSNYRIAEFYHQV